MQRYPENLTAYCHRNNTGKSGISPTIIRQKCPCFFSDGLAQKTYQVPTVLCFTQWCKKHGSETCGHNSSKNTVGVNYGVRQEGIFWIVLYVYYFSMMVSHAQCPLSMDQHGPGFELPTGEESETRTCKSQDE